MSLRTVRMSPEEVGRVPLPRAHMVTSALLSRIMSPLSDMNLCATAKIAGIEILNGGRDKRAD